MPAAHLPASVAIFGASTAEGVGDDEAGGFARRYHAWLSAQRRPAWTVVHQLGIGGNTSRDFLRRGPSELAERRADLVIVLTGCNDLPRHADTNPARRTTVEEYRANLRQLFTPLGQRLLLATTIPADPQRSGVDPALLRTYQDAASAEARAAGGEVLDLLAELTARGCADLWCRDGLHFNPAGHAWLTQRLIAWTVARYPG